MEAVSVPRQTEGDAAGVPSQDDDAAEHNAGLLSRWFFSGLARMGSACYLAFGSELFTDCSLVIDRLS